MKRENAEQLLGSLLDDRGGKGGVENMGGRFRWSVRVPDTSRCGRTAVNTVTDDRKLTEILWDICAVSVWKSVAQFSSLNLWMRRVMT